MIVYDGPYKVYDGPYELTRSGVDMAVVTSCARLALSAEVCQWDHPRQEGLPEDWAEAEEPPQAA